MRGDLLWRRRGTWSRRICWRAARSRSWRRPTACIAAGSTSSWPATARAATRPWSRAPGRRATVPTATPEEVVRAIVSLREQLLSQGHDCGAETIAYHLAQRFEEVPSVSTIWRILRREGLVVPQPQKRPRSSLIRFEAELPNEMWQADITHWPLAGGEDVEILNMIDDHSRLFCGLTRLPDGQGRRRGRRLSLCDRPARGCRRPCSATTAPCSRPPPEAARCFCSSRSSALGSLPRTRGPTTPRPAARSSACTRR